jgi:hypothetical protein
VNSLIYSNLNSNKNRDISKEYELWISIFKTVNSAVSIIDRSSLIDCPIKYSVLSESRLPSTFQSNLSYSDLVSNRCQELFDQHKTLRILWSGGIDSTLILATLIKNYDREFLKNQVKVILTNDSIIENYNFYKNFVIPIFNVEGGETIPYKIFDNQGTIITGEANDQLFGSDILKDFIIQMGSEFVNSPFSKDIIKNYYATKGLTDHEFEYWFNNITSTAHALNVPLELCSDYFWWFNFCFKWQSVITRIHAITPKIFADQLKNNYSNCIHFYNTQEFQKWSISNPQHRHFESWTNYKYHAKELIYELSQDYDYLKNKIKIGSLHNIYAGRYIYEGIDQNFQLIKNIDIEDFLK